MHVTHLFGVYYALVLWVRALYQKSESYVSVLLPAFHCGCLAVGASCLLWGGHTAVVRALHSLCAEYSLLCFYV